MSEWLLVSSSAQRAPADVPDLTRYAWLSVAAAVVTIGLKTGAWALTGSVGLLSDAAESLVNLAAAIVAVLALRVAATPANATYTYGRTKAEYFSAAAEGIMIFLAAAAILVTAAERFVNPRPIENVGVGLAVSAVAGVVNGVVAAVLLRAGRRYRSLTLVADARHLMTDVWTSAGVIAGVLAVQLTHWERLDPIIAFAVGVNIVVTGVRLVRTSATGLLDHTLPAEENAALVAILQRHAGPHVQFHGLQTRVAGRERYANLDVLVPGSWTVAQGHTFIEQIEEEMERAVPGLVVVTHLEPIEDPTSYDDIPDGQILIPDSPATPAS